MTRSPLQLQRFASRASGRTGSGKAALHLLLTALFLTATTISALHGHGLDVGQTSPAIQAELSDASQHPLPTEADADPSDCLLCELGRRSDDGEFAIASTPLSALHVEHDPSSWTCEPARSPGVLHADTHGPRAPPIHSA